MRGWAIAMGSVCACMPPPMNVGYVAMNPSGCGGVDVQGQVGMGGALPSGPPNGGGAAHVEPFVTRRVSIPIGVGVGGGAASDGFAPLRVGVRHRPLPFLAYGAGLGPSFVFDRAFFGTTGVADVELVLGLHRPCVGFSVGLRPALSFDAGGLAFYGLCDPSLAITLAPALSLTLALPVGIYHLPVAGGVVPFMSGALGVHRRF